MMAHVRLANWHGSHAPGDVIEVPDDQVQGLRYDGRISEVVDGPDQGDEQSPAETDTVNASTESEPPVSGEQSEKPAEPRRRRSKSDDE